MRFSVVFFFNRISVCRPGLGNADSYCD